MRDMSPIGACCGGEAGDGPPAGGVGVRTGGGGGTKVANGVICAMALATTAVFIALCPATQARITASFCSASSPGVLRTLEKYSWAASRFWLTVTLVWVTSLATSVYHATAFSRCE